MISRQQLQWPLAWSIATEKDPPLDYSCRVRPEEIGWPSDLCPLLFAAQYQSNGREQAEAALALAFHPMMILFTLYYLDTRTSAEEALPSWMVLFGLIYDEKGIRLQAHYPSVNREATTSQPVYGWGATALSDGEPFEFYTLHSGNSPFRKPYLMAMLNRLQGHCRHVFEKLKSWDGFRQACAQFIE